MTNAIIGENFMDLFSELTRIDNYNIDTFYLMQSSLKALPNFQDMDDFFSAMGIRNMQQQNSMNISLLS
jgi:hypothetical protein